MWAYKTQSEVGVKVLMMTNTEATREEAQIYIPEDAYDILEITEKDLPERGFRKAWDIEKGAVVMNYVLIRDIIREERNKSLKKLDLASVSAERSKDTKKLNKINAEAERLRNLPQQDDFMCENIHILKDMLLQAKQIELDS